MHKNCYNTQNRHKIIIEKINLNLFLILQLYEFKKKLNLLYSKEKKTKTTMILF